MLQISDYYVMLVLPNRKEKRFRRYSCPLENTITDAKSIAAQLIFLTRQGGKGGKKASIQAEPKSAFKIANTKLCKIHHSIFITLCWIFAI
jgi:hypothetical protein